MAITYTWSFPSLGIVYSEDGFQNVVNTVNWVYTAVDGEYSAYNYGSVGLPAPGQPFTSFDDLTPEIVTGWVVSSMGQERVDAMTASLASEINSQKNPTGGFVQPPWA